MLDTPSYFALTLDLVTSKPKAELRLSVADSISFLRYLIRGFKESRPTGVGLVLACVAVATYYSYELGRDHVIETLNRELDKRKSER